MDKKGIKNKKRTTIGKRLSMNIGLTVCIILLVTFGAMYILINNLIERNAQSEMMALSSTYESEIEKWTMKVQTELNGVLKTIQVSDFKDDDAKLLNYLKSATLDMDEDLPVGVYVGDNTNRYIDPSGWKPTADYVVTERGWYKLGIDCDTMTFGDPYMGANLGKLMVSASAKVDGKTVASSDIVLDSVTEKINNLDIIGDGYGFLLDAKSTYIVAHPNADYAGKKAEEVGDPLILAALNNATNTDKIFEIQEKGTTYFVKLNNIEGTNWILATCAKKDVIFASLKIILTSFVSMGALVVILSTLYIYLRVKVITKPIIKLTSVIGNITNGDFTTAAEVTGNDEITTMTEALNVFIERMRNIITELNLVSNKLNDESDNSNQVSDIMSQAANSQSESMKQLNDTVDELAKSIEEIAVSATSLANTVSDINTNGNEALNMIHETVEVTDAGKRDINLVSDKMINIDSVMKELEGVVKEVGDSTTEINNITGIIGDIASQTNLLALNASIEAARAGEAGKGFAVVATEIGNLANMSTDAVKNIETLVNKISQQVNDVVTKTTESVNDVSDSRSIVEQTYSTFMKIYEKVNSTNTRIVEVTKKIKEVDGVATTMAAITEEQSASTEEILATSESLYQQSLNISENSETVKTTAGELGESAGSIHQHMSSFQI